MTQTLSETRVPATIGRPVTTLGPTMTAQVIPLWYGGVQTIFRPMTSVDFAREEFGATLAEAQAFVLETCCTVCGMSNDEVNVTDRACRGCGIAACDCLVSEDGHSDDVFWCNGCRPACGGYCCND